MDLKRWQVDELKRCLMLKRDPKNGALILTMSNEFRFKEADLSKPVELLVQLFDMTKREFMSKKSEVDEILMSTTRAEWLRRRDVTNKIQEERHANGI